jgi:hypothetical protein
MEKKNDVTASKKIDVTQLARSIDTEAETYTETHALVVLNCG